jgi:hypothetical protein
MLRMLVAVPVLLALPIQAFALQCSVGSYPWTDAWGNQICKRFDNGGTSVTQGNPYNAGGCPIGSYPWVDSWGNKVCQTHAAPSQPQQRYYDTSRGCPVGTYQWMDSWGNPTCKRF